MKSLSKRMLCLVLVCIMVIGLIAIPSDGADETGSTVSYPDPVKNPLYGRWNSYNHFNSQDMENSTFYYGDDLVVTTEYPKHLGQYDSSNYMPTVYFTSNGFFETSYVKRLTFTSSDLTSYEVTNISESYPQYNLYGLPHLAGGYSWGSYNCDVITIVRPGYNTQNQKVTQIWRYLASNDTWTIINSNNPLPMYPTAMWADRWGNIYYADRNEIYYYSKTNNKWFDKLTIPQISGSIIAIYQHPNVNTNYEDTEYVYMLDSAGNIWYVRLFFAYYGGIEETYVKEVRDIQKVAKAPTNSPNDFYVSRSNYNNLFRDYPDNCIFYVTDTENDLIWVSKPGVKTTKQDECGRYWVPIKNKYRLVNGKETTHDEIVEMGAVAADEKGRIFTYFTTTDPYSKSLTGKGYLEWRSALPSLSFTTQPNAGQTACAGMKLDTQPVVRLSDGSSVDTVSLFLTDENGELIATQYLTGTTSVKTSNGYATFSDVGLSPDTPEGTYTLTAYCGGLLVTSNKFTVEKLKKITYQNPEGAVFQTVYVKPGAAIAKSEIPNYPVPEGVQRFLGWYMESGEKLEPGKVINSDLTVTAKVEDIYYNVIIEKVGVGYITINAPKQKTGGESSSSSSSSSSSDDDVLDPGPIVKPDPDPIEPGENAPVLSYAFKPGTEVTINYFNPYVLTIKDDITGEDVVFPLTVTVVEPASLETQTNSSGVLKFTMPVGHVKIKATSKCTLTLEFEGGLPDDGLYRTRETSDYYSVRVFDPDTSYTLPVVTKDGYSFETVKATPIRKALPSLSRTASD